MGQPAGGHTPAPAAESIGRMERTWGTETSQYPQEQKSIEIPRVAASETGRAQTGRFYPAGVVGPPTRDWRVDRRTV